MWAECVNRFETFRVREGLISSSVSFFATDHASALLSTGLGSVNAVMWANGRLRAQLRYDPWGKERYTQNPTPTATASPTSQLWDAELGLYDYNARYYKVIMIVFVEARYEALAYSFDSGRLCGGIVIAGGLYGDFWRTNRSYALAQRNFIANA